MDCRHAHLRLSTNKYAICLRNNVVLVWPQINETARTYFDKNLIMRREKEVPRDRQNGERPMFSLSEEAGDSFLMRKTTTGRWFFSDSKREKIRKAGFGGFKRDSMHLKSKLPVLSRWFDGGFVGLLLWLERTYCNHFNNHFLLQKKLNLSSRCALDF